jgi:cephalosporin hydroxylase
MNNTLDFSDLIAVDIKDNNPNLLYSYFVTGLVLQNKPKLVLEIGLGDTPYTSKMILKAFEINRLSGNDGQLAVIELYPKDDALKALDTVAYNGNVDVHVGDSLDEKLYDKLLSKYGSGKIDLVLIDGDHSLEHVHTEILNILTRNLVDTKKCLFVFHDIQFSPTKLGVDLVARDFNMKTFFMYENNIALAKLDY